MGTHHQKQLWEEMLCKETAQGRVTSSLLCTAPLPASANWPGTLQQASHLPLMSHFPFWIADSRNCNCSRNVCQAFANGPWWQWLGAAAPFGGKLKSHSSPIDNHKKKQKPPAQMNEPLGEDFKPSGQLVHCTHALSYGQLSTPSPSAG